jgi:hypothetical protein
MSTTTKVNDAIKVNDATKVFKNRKILSKIFDFLGDDDIRNVFCTANNKQILIYGQVQSGKTSKIMEYIKTTDVKTKILIIQNSLSMLSQYERSLNMNKINFLSVSSSNISIVIYHLRRVNSNIVLLVMNNSCRRDALDIILSRTKINVYSLIMDESDLYYKNMMRSSLYKNAIECVHITATPFSSGYKAYFDEVIVIPPKKEYISFKKLDITFIPEVKCENETIMNIIKDFIKVNQGIMLITIHSRILQMENLSRHLANKSLLLNVPIVMLSSKNTLYFNKKIKELPRMSISEVISGLEEHQHIIFIANRLATRGINYSNLTYSRHLTHQIIKKNDRKTNFIQRCRILGNKEGITEKLKLYCLKCDEDYFKKVLQKIDRVENNVDYLKLGYVSSDDIRVKLKLTSKPKLVRAQTL